MLLRTQSIDMASCSANVGFLAIPSVAESGGQLGSLLHYASISSALFSFVSVVTGQMLIRFHPEDIVCVSLYSVHIPYTNTTNGPSVALLPKG
jgi:hypothetical protein